MKQKRTERTGNERDGDASGPASGITLIVISAGEDEASENIGGWLRAIVDWEEGPEVEGVPSWRCADVRLWWRWGRQLGEDCLDDRWEEETGEKVEQTIHLTRHTSKNCVPMVTIHAFGNPQLLWDEDPPEGGTAGLAVPPASGMAQWYRALVRLAREAEIQEWETHLEATHRGPSQEGPAMAIELGSNEEHWRSGEGGALIALLVAEELGLEHRNPFGERGASR